MESTEIILSLVGKVERVLALEEGIDRRQTEHAVSFQKLEDKVNAFFTKFDDHRANHPGPTNPPSVAPITVANGLQETKDERDAVGFVRTVQKNWKLIIFVMGFGGTAAGGSWMVHGCSNGGMGGAAPSAAKVMGPVKAVP